VTPIATEPRPLSNGLAKQLLIYATIAGAGAAACASPAQAEIVYTPVRTNLDFVYPFDLNHDGIPDFQVGSSYLSGFVSLTVFPLVKGNKIAGTQGTQRNRCFAFGTDAAALPAGALIGPGRSFQSRANCMAAGYSGLHGGPWFEARDRYLGFAFLIDGETHYGWARLSVRSAFSDPGMARILGYAYETVPGKAIIAGDEGHSTETSTAHFLGALALGNSGLDIWRSKETVLDEVLTGDTK
jgi:hypothetical protein